MSYTGWRRLIESPKLQIIFHKRATKYRSLLRKMTYKDKGSYESSPPCTWIYVYRMYSFMCLVCIHSCVSHTFIHVFVCVLSDTCMIHRQYTQTHTYRYCTQTHKYKREQTHVHTHMRLYVYELPMHMCVCASAPLFLSHTYALQQHIKRIPHCNNTLQQGILTGEGGR